MSDISALAARVEAGAAYDTKGREFELGDIVKIYHFTAAVRRKKHYMYKQITGKRVWPSGGEGWFFSHLDMKERSGFYVMLDGKRYDDYEIVQGIAYDWEDRARQPTSTPAAALRSRA